MNRRLVITLIAISVAIPLHWYLNIPGPIPEPFNMPAWRWQLLSLFAGLYAVLPGFLVGFVNGRHGILLGAIVGYVGHLLFAPSLEFADQSLSSIRYMLQAAALAPLGHAVISAAGGGAGQLLRSNTSLERTRER